jgi:hypothetical protein
MKINLNEGTIESKSLSFDGEGNLSITGRITATSGYIGDGVDNGFLIAPDNSDTDLYCLSYKQSTLLGSEGKGGDPGVYISPQGIGMGHGHLVIPNSGLYLDVAGAKFQYIKEWNTYDSEGNIETHDVSLLAINASDGISMGRNDYFDGYHYSSLLLTPRSTQQTSNNAKLDLWGSMWASGGFSQASDSRLKTNIIDPDINAIELFKKIETKSFDWIDSGEHIDVGLIAQQVEKIIPSVVSTDEKTELKSINFTNLVPYLIKAVQELAEIVYPSPMLLSLDENIETETRWVDDMTDDEKQYYVKLSRAPQFVGAEVEQKGENLNEI